MFIADYIENSLLDWPGKIATVVFLSGCNFRCPWCHNKDLALGKLKNQIPISKVLETSRKGWIDGFVITGGEPTIYKDLFNLCYEIRKSGFGVKLDTNGSQPNVVQKLIDEKLVDFIAMDIKASLRTEKYSKVCGVSDLDIKVIERTIDIILNSQIECLFRTTVVPGLVDDEDIKEISDRVSGKNYILQKFVPREKKEELYVQML